MRTTVIAAALFTAVLVGAGLHGCTTPGPLPPVLPPLPCDITQPAPCQLGEVLWACPDGSIVTVGEPDSHEHGCHVAPNGQVWSIEAWKEIGYGIWHADGGGQ